jgi:probable F420-dependent oxidoreductase
MHIGVATVPGERGMPITALARALEERGFESLFVPEHTHIPAKIDSPTPSGRPVDAAANEYAHILDPFVALAAAGAVTTRLKLGTGVCLVIEHDPIVLAKQVASLDQLSGGRVLFGVGGGWNREEMRNHGTDPAGRWRLLRERVAAMQALWTQDEASYHGTLVHFERVWQWPKPLQQPHPPILMGGDGPNTLRRVVAYADGWMPVAARGAVPLAEKIAELQQLAARAGRPPIPVTIFRAAPRTEALRRYVALGVERCVFWLPAEPAERVLPLLDEYAEVARAYVDGA